jgi:hypothetical protein
MQDWQEWVVLGFNSLIKCLLQHFGHAVQCQNSHNECERWEIRNLAVRILKHWQWQVWREVCHFRIDF